MHSRRLVSGFLRRAATDESASVIVMTAVVMVALLGLAALVADAGILYLHRSQLNNAVDAAALAGVQELPDSTWAAERRAQAYGELNGIDPSEMVVTFSTDHREITVEARRPVELFFARVLGYRTAEVMAKARAQVGTVVAYGGVVPLGVQQQAFVYGKQYMLKYGPQPGDGVWKGNFGALSLGGTGANVFGRNLEFGYPELLKVGDKVWTEPGNMAGKTQSGVRNRIARDTSGCTFEEIKPGCTRLVIVPVISPYSKPGRNQVEILGFAAFFLEGNNGDSYIVGRFVEMAVDGIAGDGNGSYGLRAYRLVE